LPDVGNLDQGGNVFVIFAERNGLSRARSLFRDWSALSGK
jgi:hypothetical protein